MFSNMADSSKAGFIVADSTNSSALVLMSANLRNHWIFSRDLHLGLLDGVLGVDLVGPQVGHARSPGWACRRRPGPAGWTGSAPGWWRPAGCACPARPARGPRRRPSRSCPRRPCRRRRGTSARDARSGYCAGSPCRAHALTSEQGFGHPPDHRQAGDVALELGHPGQHLGRRRSGRSASGTRPASRCGAAGTRGCPARPAPPG